MDSSSYIKIPRAQSRACENIRTLRHMLTDQDIIKAFRVGFGFDDEAPFISRFRDGQGLIFGIGETIAEYWAAFEVCYTAGLFSDEITDATSRQNALS